MTKLFLAIIGLILSVYPSNAQWEVLNQGHLLWSVEFIDADHGWITGNEGKLLKTTDGGISWTTISVDNKIYISRVDFINESVGWAVGTKDTFALIIKTTDSGKNWSIQKQLSGTWLNTISIVDENNLYAMSFNGILKSSDGGLSWNDVSPKTAGYINLSSMVFLSVDVGIATGNSFDGTIQSCLIFKTTDGGKSWKEERTRDFINIFDLQILNDSIICFKAYSDTTYSLCTTGDLFASWSVKQKSRNWFGSYQFINSNTAYVIMYDSTSANYIVKTSDGGVTWQQVPSPDISWRISFDHIYFNNSSNGILVGSMGCIFKTSDGGNQWSLIKNAYPFSGSVFIIMF